MNKRCAAVREFEPEVIFLFSCAARKMFWGERADVEMVPFTELGSVSGFCTGGELFRDPHGGTVFEHNITLLSIAMREGEKKGLELPEAKVEDSMLKGQAYLLKRLAHLVQSTNEDLQRMNEELHRIAITDELTGLYNRRKTQEEIHEVLSSSAGGVGLIMVDVDHFKQVNDVCGHDVGDKVLKSLARILQEGAEKKKGGLAGRWGGEEFFLVLPGATLEETAEQAELIRQQVEKYAFAVVRRLTASFGVVWGDIRSDYDELLIRADEALYSAKERGRNQVFVKE